MIKNVYKILLLTIIIFLFGDVFSFCDEIVDNSETNKKSETIENSSNVYFGIFLFATAFALYMAFGMYFNTQTVKEISDSISSAPTSPVSSQSMSSYVESLSDFYDNPNVGYPETKGNQP